MATFSTWTKRAKLSRSRLPRHCEPGQRRGVPAAKDRPQRIDARSQRTRRRPGIYLPIVRHAKLMASSPSPRATNDSLKLGRFYEYGKDGFHGRGQAQFARDSKRGREGKYLYHHALRPSRCSNRTRDSEEEKTKISHNCILITRTCAYAHCRSIIPLNTACCFLINSPTPCRASPSIFCNCASSNT